MKKGSDYVINLKSFLGRNSDFTPNYQFERPLEFAALVHHYMKFYYNPATEEDKYLTKLSLATDYANKSILLDKLGIESYEDPEKINSDVFKATMVDLAKSDPHLKVEGENISYEPEFSKSFNSNEIGANEYYESLWKKAFDTLHTSERIDKCSL
jgi:hypothetical protein